MPIRAAPTTENDTLSRERADAVAAVLAGQGIDASRLLVESPRGERGHAGGRRSGRLRARAPRHHTAGAAREGRGAVVHKLDCGSVKAQAGPGGAVRRLRLTRPALRYVQSISGSGRPAAPSRSASTTMRIHAEHQAAQLLAEAIGLQGPQGLIALHDALHLIRRRDDAARAWLA